jgi:hypothetical protein
MNIEVSAAETQYEEISMDGAKLSRPTQQQCAGVLVGRVFYSLALLAQCGSVRHHGQYTVLCITLAAILAPSDRHLYLGSTVSERIFQRLKRRDWKKSSDIIIWGAE